MKTATATQRVLCLILCIAAGADAKASVLLGEMTDWFGGGQFTISSEIPNGIYFGYGYGGFDGVYVFEDIVIPTGSVISLFPADDSDFHDVANALENGLPVGDSFYATLGFSPSPPFHSQGVYTYALPVPVPADAVIEYLVLTMSDFSITSSPAPGGETLWEIPLTRYSIAAYGATAPMPLPSGFLLLGGGLLALARVASNKAEPRHRVVVEPKRQRSNLQRPT
jgi:hypothetical protein